MRVSTRNRVLKIITATVTTLLMGFVLILSFQNVGVSAPITTWTELADTPLPVDTASSGIVYNDGFIYVIGGKQLEDGKYVASDKVFFSAVNDDGSLAGWSETSSLPDYRYLHAVAANDKYIYSIGGAGRGDRFGTVSIFRSEYLEGGELAEWQTIGNYPLSPPPANVDDGINLHEAVIVKDRLYVIGGFLGGYSVEGDPTLSLVQFAQIDANGNLSSWTTTSELPRALRRFAASVNGNRIFVSGGSNGTKIADNERYFDQIWYADVQANGQLTGWQLAERLPTQTYYHRSVILDDKLVVIGGAEVVNGQFRILDRVTSYEIAADGSLGEPVTEAALTQPRMRHAAVTVTQFGTDYIYSIGGYSSIGDGSASENSATNTVYRSAPPAPPPTPTPLPGVRLGMNNEPERWVAPDEEILYTITYENPGDQPVEEVRIDDTIPEEAELIPDSVSNAGPNAPDINENLDIISWEVGELGAGEKGEVFYRVRRRSPLESADTVLTITKTAPEQVDQGALITYELAVKNNLAGIPVQNLVISDTIPIYATNVTGPDQIVDGVAIWSLPELAGGASVTKTMTVRSERTLVNSEYGVLADDGRYRAVGEEVIVTWVGNTDPGVGDGVVIPNNAQARWIFDGQEKRTFSNWVRNPSSNANYDVYLPITKR